MSEELGTFVTINPAKLGREGLLLLGQAQALDKWVLMFTAYCDKSLDLHERRILTEVVKALVGDAERVKLVLAQHAIKRKAATCKELTVDANAE